MTKIRTMRLEDDLWEGMRKKADEENTTITEIMKKLIIADLTGGK